MKLKEMDNNLLRLLLETGKVGELTEEEVLQLVKDKTNYADPDEDEKPDWVGTLKHDMFDMDIQEPIDTFVDMKDLEYPLGAESLEKILAAIREGIIAKRKIPAGTTVSGVAAGRTDVWWTIHQVDSDSEQVEILDSDGSWAEKHLTGVRKGE